MSSHNGCVCWPNAGRRSRAANPAETKLIRVIQEEHGAQRRLSTTSSLNHALTSPICRRHKDAYTPSRSSNS